MSWHLTKCCFYVLALVDLASAQECTYKCDECKHLSGRYYDFNETSGECRRNQNEDVRYFLLGWMYCENNPNVIRDESTCAEIRSIAEGKRERTIGHIFKASDVNVTWEPETAGCRVWGSGPSWSALEGIKFNTRVCLQTWDINKILISLGCGTAVGIILAFFGTGCGRKDHKKYDREVQGTEKDFEPGAKLLAATALITGGGARMLTFWFRVSQVITNGWFPALLLIYVNPVVLLGVYTSMYILPALCVAGTNLFLEPVYILTPPDVSLFGIDHSQPDYTLSFLYSGVRPFLVCGILRLITLIFTSTVPESSQGLYNFNVSGFLRSSMMEGYGPLVLDFVVIGTFVGVLSHLCMSLYLVCKAWKSDEFYGSYGLQQDIPKWNDVHRLRGELQKMALEWKDADEEEAEEAQDEFNERVGSIYKKKKGSGYGIVQVSFLTKFSVYFAILLAVVDLGAYAYKIFVFLRGGRYVLAGIIMCAISESFAVLIISGTLRRARKALHMTISSGVPTVDYLACCQWDDDIAGVPYLLTTIYGLPLAGIHTWYNTLSGIFFICTGTRAMAMFIMSAVDSDMFDVNEEEKAKLLDIFKYEQEAADSVEEEDDDDE